MTAVIDLRIPDVEVREVGEGGPLVRYRAARPGDGPNGELARWNPMASSGVDEALQTLERAGFALDRATLQHYTGDLPAYTGRTFVRVTWTGTPSPGA